MKEDLSALYKIAQLALNEADRLDLEDTLSGGAGDSGEILRSLTNGWMAGLAGIVPKDLAPFAKQLAREQDPDWTLYQKLRRKFGA